MQNATNLGDAFSVFAVFCQIYTKILDIFSRKSKKIKIFSSFLIFMRPLQNLERNIHPIRLGSSLVAGL